MTKNTNDPDQPVLLQYGIKLELATPVHKAIAKSARLVDFLKVPKATMLNSLAWVDLKAIIDHPEWDQEVFDVLTSKGRMRLPTEEEAHAYVHRSHGGHMVRTTYIKHGLIVDDQFVLVMYFHLKQPEGKTMLWVPELFTDTLPLKKQARAEREVNLDSVL